MSNPNRPALGESNAHQRPSAGVLLSREASRGGRHSPSGAPGGIGSPRNASEFLPPTCTARGPTIPVERRTTDPDEVMGKPDDRELQGVSLAQLLEQASAERRGQPPFGPLNPVPSDEDLLDRILRLHPGLTREEVLEEVEAFGFDLTGPLYKAICEPREAAREVTSGEED